MCPPSLICSGAHSIPRGIKDTTNKGKGIRIQILSGCRVLFFPSRINTSSAHLQTVPHCARVCRAQEETGVEIGPNATIFFLLFVLGVAALTSCFLSVERNLFSFSGNCGTLSLSVFLQRRHCIARAVLLIQ